MPQQSAKSRACQSVVQLTGHAALTRGLATFVRFSNQGHGGEISGKSIELVDTKAAKTFLENRALDAGTHNKERWVQTYAAEGAGRHYSRFCGPLVLPKGQGLRWR